MEQKEKLVIGVDAIKYPTPNWANWMLRGTVIVTSILVVFVAATKLISEDIKYELMLLIKCIDMGVYGFSRLFGIVIDDKK